MNVPVWWLNRHPDICEHKSHWDTSIFQELILKGYPQWNPGYSYGEPDAAVVMVAGRFHHEDVDWINEQIARLSGVVVCVTSDEEALFPWWELEHPNMRRWVMTPRPETRRAGVFGGVRFIGEGWSPNTPKITAPLRTASGDNRRWDVAFAGQVTHPRRVEMRRGLERVGGSVAVQPTTSFAAGLDRPDYLQLLTDTRFAPCPSGPVTADSFRIYEALEAGCVPILDGIDGKGRDATNLWHLIFGPQCPLPIIHDWAKLPTMIESLLPEWETRAAMIGRWWKDRKQQWVDEMRADVEAVS